jgi:hypothetical protein
MARMDQCRWPLATSMWDVTRRPTARGADTFKRAVVTNSQKPVRKGYTHTTHVKATYRKVHLVMNTGALSSSTRRPLPSWD